MQLNIDLNKLSMNELEIVLSLMKKSDSTKPEVTQPIQKSTSITKDEDIKKKYPPHRKTRKWTQEMDNMVIPIFEGTKRRKVLLKRLRKVGKKLGVSEKAVVSRSYGKGWMAKWNKDKKDNSHESPPPKGMMRKHPFMPRDAISIGLGSGIIKEERFPVLKYMDTTFNVILQGIIKNVISKGYKMSMPVEGEAIGVPKKDWNDFASEFMSKSNDIALFFGVENRFKVSYVGGIAYLSYKN